VLVLIAGLGWLAVRGTLAHRHLTTARADLTAAKTALLDRRLGEVDEHIQRAGAETSSARGLTSDPIWWLAARVPYAGASLAEAADVARVADDIARNVLPPAMSAAQVLDPKALRAPDGTIDVRLLERARPDLVAAADNAAGADAQLRREVRKGVVGPVRRASTDLRAQSQQLVNALRGAERGVRLAPALLGSDRPRRYFILIQQNSESRGTGGLPGGFAILTADRGRMRVTAQGSNVDLKNGPLPPPAGVAKDYINRYAGDGAFDLWVNVNLSPDLPTVAKVIADRWKHQSGQDIDGVVALDSQALADILRGSPPIPVPGGRTLTTANIVDYLAVGQYRDFAAPAGGSAGVDPNQERKQLLVTIARAATDRLVGGGGSTLELMRGLADATSSGHLRMASDDPKLHGGLREAGIDGGLPEGPAPVAYPVVFNSSGGKLDYFLDRSVRYEVGSCEGTQRSSSISFTLTNRAPTGLPPYLTNPGNLPGIANTTTNRLTVLIYATRGARLRSATSDGKPLGKGDGSFLSASSEAGLPVWSTLIDVPSGASRTLRLELTEPTVKGTPRVPQQPLARAMRTSVHVPAC
jgi:hypothetical protein